MKFAVGIGGFLALLVSANFHLFGQIADFGKKDFSRPDSIAALYDHHPIENLRELSLKLTGPLERDVDKFRSIYRWVCDNIKNDPALYLKIKRMREKYHGQPDKLMMLNNEIYPKAIKRMVNEHKTICTGYAYLVKELAYFAGIDCEIVHGYSRTSKANVGGDGIPNHSWNAVKLNGKWYLCDPTWSSGVIENSVFKKNFNEIFFLLEPSLFVLNHYPLDTSWILMDNPPTLTQFLNRPLVYENGLKEGILPTYPVELRSTIKKGEKLTFQLTSSEDLQNIELQIMHGGNENSIHREIHADQEGYYYLTHQFDSKGIYDVHFKLNDKYLFTYLVRTTK